MASEMQASTMKVPPTLTLRMSRKSYGCNRERQSSFRSVQKTLPSLTLHESVILLLH
jgi:hypothetical protein